MRRPTRLPYRGRLIRLGEVSKAIRPAAAPGYWRQHVHKESERNTGNPKAWSRNDQPDAREGQAGRPGAAERFIVPRKPGNSGGGKGPQFKTNAPRSEGPGDWGTYQLRRVFRNCGRRCTRKRRREVLSESRMREICLSGSMRGCGNGVRAEPLRHRQTKEAATDMFDLKPPRHIPTLHISHISLIDGMSAAGGKRRNGTRVAFGFRPCGHFSLTPK
jgi:hypothetical protein